jgi:hypothetical protein
MRINALNINKTIERARLGLNDIARWNNWLRNAAVLAGLFAVLYGIGWFLPIGYDWRNFFGRGLLPNIWTPWTVPVVRVLNLPTVFALTVMAVGIRAYRYKATPLALSLALVSLPTLWVLFLGNLDGLALLGLVLLPWGVPLVTMKPQISAFALLANRRWFLAGIIWGVISLLIWGLWPLNLREIFSAGWKLEWVQDISLFPWGLLITLPLLWFSRGDEDLLMAAGSFSTPHLFPYHFILLMPALARMRWPWMILTWAVSWTPLLSNWLGPWAWHLGNLMGVCFWLGIYLNRRKRSGL